MSTFEIRSSSALGRPRVLGGGPAIRERGDHDLDSSVRSVWMDWLSFGWRVARFLPTRPAASGQRRRSIHIDKAMHANRVEPQQDGESARIGHGRRSRSWFRPTLTTASGRPCCSGMALATAGTGVIRAPVIVAREGHEYRLLIAGVHGRARPRLTHVIGARANTRRHDTQFGIRARTRRTPSRVAPSPAAIHSSFTIEARRRAMDDETVPRGGQRAHCRHSRSLASPRIGLTSRRTGWFWNVSSVLECSSVSRTPSSTASIFD